jgi:hypothetical protein
MIYRSARQYMYMWCLGEMVEPLGEITGKTAWAFLVFFVEHFRQPPSQKKEEASSKVWEVNKKNKGPW